MRTSRPSNSIKIFPILSQSFGTFRFKLIAGIWDFAFERLFYFEITCGFKFFYMPGQISSCQAKRCQQEIKIRMFNSSQNHHNSQPCRLVDNLIKLHQPCLFQDVPLFLTFSTRIGCRYMQPIQSITLLLELLSSHFLRNVQEMSILAL